MAGEMLSALKNTLHTILNPRPMKPSLGSKIFSGILQASRFKKIVEKQAQKKVRRSKKSFVPPRISRSYTTTLQICHHKAIGTFASKEKVTRTHVLFFHGGAYLFEASAGHWQLAEKIVQQAHCRMSLIDYPLAPEHTYRDTFAMVEGAYDLLNQQYPEDEFVLMGDSAGGGLALALSQKLAAEKHPRLPVANVLLSPWLDLTMSHPGIEQQVKKDHILTVKMLRIAGEKYAGGDQPDHYLLSPINGKLHGLPRTLVFYGTEELFYADCTKLKSLAEAAGADFVFQEYAGMQHDWAIFPIPERDRVVKAICDFLRP